MYVDNGLSLNDKPLKLIKEFYKFKIIEVDAGQRFLKKLKNIKDPEDKRKIIGDEYIEVLKEEADKLNQIEFLAQGTDFIQILETGNPKTSKFVKSHHNVTGPTNNQLLKLVEPLKPLFKEEIIKLAKTMGLPNKIINQHPFPSEGLAIRIMGDVTEEKLKIIRKSDAILKEEIKKSHLDTDHAQFFTILTDTKSVTSIDFKRKYEYALVIRAITSEDCIAEIYLQIEFHSLRKATKKILKEVEGVNRVLLDMSGQNPNIVEWE